MGWFNSKNGLIGDEPLDIIGDAVAKIKKSYNTRFTREPKVEEIRDVFNYVMRPLENASKTEKTEVENNENT